MKYKNIYSIKVGVGTENERIIKSDTISAITVGSKLIKIRFLENNEGFSIELRNKDRPETNFNTWLGEESFSSLAHCILQLHEKKKIDLNKMLLKLSETETIQSYYVDFNKK